MAVRLPDRRNSEKPGTWAGRRPGPRRGAGGEAPALSTTRTRGVSASQSDAAWRWTVTCSGRRRERASAGRVARCPPARPFGPAFGTPGHRREGWQAGSEPARNRMANGVGRSDAIACSEPSARPRFPAAARPFRPWTMPRASQRHTAWPGWRARQRGRQDHCRRNPQEFPQDHLKDASKPGGFLHGRSGYCRRDE